MVELRSFARNFFLRLMVGISKFLWLLLIFGRSEKLSYLHNFITNLSTHFSVVILEEQPVPSKSWIWESSRPVSSSGGPAGV